MKSGTESVSKACTLFCRQQRLWEERELLWDLRFPRDHEVEKNMHIIRIPWLGQQGAAPDPSLVSGKEAMGKGLGDPPLFLLIEIYSMYNCVQI